MSIERRFDDFNRMTRMDRRAFLAGLIACAGAAAVPGLMALRERSHLVAALDPADQGTMLFFRVSLAGDGSNKPLWIRQVTEPET